MVVSGFMDSEKENLDYIIVLGSQVKPSGPAVVTRLRLDRAYEYAVNNPDTVIIVSGGQGSNEPATEASVMKEYLVSKGIDESRIIAEDKSTNTSENLQFSMALTDGLQDSSVGIVSSEFHMFRALAIAKKCGYTDTYGIPARSVRLYLPNNMLRESIGILKDFLMGNL
ncbi:MAG: YdcF family protein [Lachnospiraceae bacterium]|nr:YdcF family protein [Lachnospiraceae bacterium]